MSTLSLYLSEHPTGVRGRCHHVIERLVSQLSFQPSPFKGYPVREIEVEMLLLSILSIALVYYFEFINF